MNKKSIEARIHGGAEFEFALMDEIDSTSDYIKREIKSGGIKKFPFVAAAKSQTAGRGRLQNRSFFSPVGGLYFSCAFLPSQIKCSHELITIGAGVAAAKAVEKFCECPFSIKWVNDIMYRGKKAGGVLCENVWSETEQSGIFIIGIGINASSAAVNGFMTEKVGALPREVFVDELLGEILNNLLNVFSDTSGAFLNEYNERLAIRGKEVEITRKGTSERATVLCATKDGLVCKTAGGENITVRTGDEIVSDLYEKARE